MKKYITLIICGLLIIFSNNTLYATGIMGSDISWKCVGKDSFLIKLVVYGTCDGNPLQSSPIYFKCAFNGVNVANPLNISVGTPVDVTPVCNGSCTHCSNPGCSFPYGFNRYTMQGLVVLSSAGTCCNIKISWSKCCRDLSITTGASGASLYTEATLDRCLSPCDNSPTFSNPPFAIVCAGQPVTISQSESDMDIGSGGNLLDSIIYQWTPPLTDSVTAATYNGSYTYNNPINYWGFANPNLPFPRGFHLDPSTGDIQFQPMAAQVTVMSLLVNEYRKGALIGQLRRNMEVIVMNCTNNNHPPTIPSPTATIFEVCSGNSVVINFTTNDIDASDTVTIGWNNAIPKAKWTTTNGTTKHPTATFTWTPSDNDASSIPYSFGVTAKDNACPTYGSYTRSFQILVKPRPNATVTIADSGCGFYNMSGVPQSGIAPTYLWHCSNPADSFSYSGRVVLHHFSQGTYPVTLTMVAAGCSHIYSDTIHVDSFLTMTLPKDFQTCYGTRVSLTATTKYARGKVTYKWWSNKIVFPEKGNTKALIITQDTAIYCAAKDTYGCSITDTIRITKHNLPLVELGPDQTICNGSKLVIIETCKLDRSKISSRVWTNIVGGNLLGADTFLIVSDSGHYRCTIKDTLGCIGSDSVRVFKNPPPVAAFSISDTSECLSSNNFIFNNSSSYSTKYLWKFGDNTASTVFSPKHSYHVTGTYTVKLVAISVNECRDSLYRNLYVRPQPVSAFTTSDTSECLKGNSFMFSNQSTGASGYLWEFGDNTTSTQPIPFHTYNLAGKYSVKLVAISNYGCQDSQTKNIYIRPHPVTSFIVNDSDQCLQGNYFIFTNNSSISSGAFTSYWEFGDSNSSISSPTHVFKTDGLCAVKLIMTSDYGCSDSLIKSIVVYPQPQVTFNINDSIQCLKNNRFIFTNTSTIKNGTLNYIWCFGDYDSSKVINPTHVYNTANTFSVKLIANSSKGCSGQLVKLIQIIPPLVVNLGRDTVLFDYQSLILDAGTGFDNYLWSDNFNDHSIIVDTNGIGLGKKLFWVLVEKEGCYGYDSIYVTFIHYSSIDHNLNEFDILVYPNPTHAILNVEINSMNKDINMSLTDLIGKQVKSLKVSARHNPIIQTLDLSGLANGVYFLNIRGEDGNKIVKLIKY